MNMEYYRNGNYCVPDLKLPEEARLVGQGDRLYQEYLKEAIRSSIQI